MGVGLEALVPVIDPFHGPAELLGRVQQHGRLRIAGVFGPEPAADVGRYVMYLVRLDLQHIGKCGPVRMDVLRRIEKLVALRRFVEHGYGAARLDRACGHAVVSQV